MLALLAPDAALTGVLDAAKPLRGRTRVTRADLAGLKAAVRAWLASRLPRTEGLEDELRGAGLLGKGRPGYIQQVETTPPVVVVRLAVPCGSEDAVYLANPPLRELSPSPPEGYLSTVMGVHSGGGMTLVARRAVQCNSFWNELSYGVYRGGARVFEGRHSIWLGEWGYRVDLQPDEFTIRLEGHSIDVGQVIRTHVLRYRLHGAKVERVDPVALEPRDFVDEWLTQPWSVMRTRSAPGLQRWHRKLHSAEGVFGEFEFVRECPNRPGDWHVAVGLEPPAYFLLHQSGERFQMLQVAGAPVGGCEP